MTIVPPYYTKATKGKQPITYAQTFKYTTTKVQQLVGFLNTLPIVIMKRNISKVSQAVRLKNNRVPQAVGLSNELPIVKIL